MDISIISQLKEFEKEQESILEKKKKLFVTNLKKQKKEFLDKVEMEKYELTSGKHDVLEKAKQKAKKQAQKKKQEYKEKKEIIDSKASQKKQEIVDMIFSEFKNV